MESEREIITTLKLDEEETSWLWNLVENSSDSQGEPDKSEIVRHRFWKALKV